MNMKSIFKSAVAAFLLVSSFVVVAQDAAPSAEPSAKELLTEVQTYATKLNNAYKNKKFEQLALLWTEFDNLLANGTYGPNDIRRFIASNTTFNALDPRNNKNQGYFSGLSKGATSTLKNILHAYLNTRLAGQWRDENDKKSFEKAVIAIFDTMADFFKLAKKANYHNLHDWMRNEDLKKHIGSCMTSEEIHLDLQTQITTEQKGMYFNAQGANTLLKAECVKESRANTWHPAQGKTQKK